MPAFPVARAGAVSRASTPALVACAAYAAVFVIGRLGVRALNLDPLTLQGASAPFAVLLALLVAGVGIAVTVGRRSGPVLSAAAAGVFAGWCSTAVTAYLQGTPYGYGLMSGDAGRVSAFATHFSTTVLPTDPSDPSNPVEYPPLYPMLVGRASALTGIEAWRLFGTAQSLLAGLTVLTGFLLWNRLVGPGLALVLSVAAFTGVSEPSKGNETLALAAFLPLVVGAFGRPPGVRRINPFLAGIAFGVMVPLYPSFLMYSLLGIAFVLWDTWRAESDRRRYLRDVAVCVGTAFVLSSWYLVPLIVTFAGEKQVVADLFTSAGLTNQFPVLNGDSPLFALQLLGAVGIVAFWRTAWWSRPLGWLAAGVVVAKALFYVRYAVTGHHFLLLYVPYVLRAAATVAGVLTLCEIARLAGPVLAGRVDVPRRLAGALASAVALGTCAWNVLAPSWMPSPAGSADRALAAPIVTNLGTAPHAEYLPDGRAPEYAFQKMNPAFPAQAVYAVVDRELGPGRHTVLSNDQRMFSFRAFTNYLPRARESSPALIRWDDRRAEVNKLAQATTPAELANAMASTPFGPIDVMVLSEDDGRARWAGTVFRASALAGAPLSVTRGLPGGYVVVIRRP